MRYFSFNGCFIEQKKKWLRETFSGGHNKMYSYNYETIGNLWRGGVSSKKVVGVYIDNNENAKKYMDKWEKEYKYKINLELDQVGRHPILAGNLLTWCELNVDGKFSLKPMIIVMAYRKKRVGYLFTSSRKTDAMAFKLRWV